MLRMVDIEYIRKKHFVDGWSIRLISRQLQISRQSVRRALKSAEPPRYTLTKPRPCPVMDPYREVIQAWLDADEKAPPKQRHTARRIYDRLVAEYGFSGGQSTVRAYVAKLRNKAPEAFIPLTAGWGEEAQVDWGKAVVQIAGKPTDVFLFCLRMRASGVPFVWAAPTEKLEAFLEGHVRAFAWLDGVPAHCVYDNPKTAVVRILSGPEREEHTRFSSLRAHYLFDSHFCNPASGHEKGAVENLVGYVRRNALVPVPDLPSWDALRELLLTWCERERHARQAKWEQEQAALRPLPAQLFRSAATRMAVVSRLSLVTFDRSRYSVPTKYVGRTLRIDAYTDRVEVWNGTEQVAVHVRSHCRGKTILSLPHYLDALARKPRAASQAAVIQQLDPIYKQVQDQLCSAKLDGYRDFLAILLLHREFPAAAVTAALKDAHQKHCLDPHTVRQILLNQLAPQVPLPNPVPEHLDQISVAPVDVSRYDLLLGGVGA